MRRDKTILVASNYFDYSHMKYQDMRKELKGIPLYYINQNSAVHKAVSNRVVLDFISEEIKLKKGRDEVIDEIGMILTKVDEILEKIIARELEEEEKKAEDMEKLNRDHIESQAGLYDTSLYDETPEEDAMSDIDFEDSMNASNEPSDDLYEQPASSGYEESNATVVENNSTEQEDAFGDFGGEEDLYS